MKKEKEKEKESEWQRGWAQNCLYVSCQPSQSAALLSVGQAGSQSVWCRHARKLRPTLCALAISASSDRFTRSVVPTTKFRCFSWCSLPVRTWFLVASASTFGLCSWVGSSIYTRMWNLGYARDLVLGLYSRFGLWVMLKMWAWVLLDRRHYCSCSATSIPKFNLLAAFLACIQPIFTRDSW